MKEPIIVKLVILQSCNQEYLLQEILLPLKKINLYCTITKDRFLRFLMKMNIVQEEDINFVCFEFYDHTQFKLVSEKQVFNSNNNHYSFSEFFLGKPGELVLKTCILYETSQCNMRQLDQTIVLYEEEKQKVIQEQEQLKKEIENQKQQFQKMREDLDAVQNLAKEQMNKILKKTADVVILYSNPLISVDKDLKEALFMDYAPEIDEIVNQIKQSGKQIKYEIFQATISNLDIALSQNPIIIHLIIHGDYDVDQAKFYFEFQEDGVSRRMYTDELQETINHNNRKLKRIKLICFSSMIAHDIIPYLTPIFPSVEFVVSQKLFNSFDNFTTQFWRFFYLYLFKEMSVSYSKRQAEAEIEKAFRDSISDDDRSVKICCCFHRHDEECVYDPSKIGYEKSHSLHLKCQQQLFVHRQCESDCDNFHQCDKNCLGLIYHLKYSEKCIKQNDECVNYKERFDQLAEYFNTGSQDAISEDIFEYSIPFGLGTHAFKDSLDRNVCCCSEIRVFQNEIYNTEPKVQFIRQHLINQKFGLYQQHPEQSENLITFSQNNFIQFGNYIAINKQIIIICSKNYSKINFNNPILKALFTYFEKYYFGKKQKLITFPSEYGECHRLKWQVDNNFFQIMENDQKLISNAYQFIQQNNKASTFQIVVLQKIDQYCDNQQFLKTFMEMQKHINDDTIIIFGLSNKSKEQVINAINEQLLQIIDYDLVESQLELLKQKKC